jgi:hypothetical protein
MLVQQEHKVLQVRKVTLDHKVQLVLIQLFLDLLVLKAQLDLKEPQEPLGHKDPQVHKDLLVRRALRVPQDLREPLERTPR